MGARYSAHDRRAAAVGEHSHLFDACDRSDLGVDAFVARYNDQFTVSCFGRGQRGLGLDRLEGDVDDHRREHDSVIRGQQRQKDLSGRHGALLESMIT